jgi:transcriptional regulator with XRE-family HTH domain
MENIGTRLRELREAMGLFQREIEKRTGIRHTYISEIECGHSVPGILILERWTKALGISLYEFFRKGINRRMRSRVMRLTAFEKRLFELLIRLDEDDQRLILSIARTMGKQKGKRG